MRPATPNAPPNTPRRLVNRFILASHQTCRSFLRASLSERVHYPILTILTEDGWARLDRARHRAHPRFFIISRGPVARRPQTARVRRAHHPPHLFTGAGGWAGLHCARPPSTPSASARNESILSARCASTTGSPAAPSLFPVCATREHVRRPGHHTPALVCGVREQAEHPSHP